MKKLIGILLLLSPLLFIFSDANAWDGCPSGQTKMAHNYAAPTATYKFGCRLSVCRPLGKRNKSCWVDPINNVESCFYNYVTENHPATYGACAPDVDDGPWM